MPAANLLIIVLAAIISVACYFRTSRNPYTAVLERAFQQIDERYVEPIDSAELFAGAMDGMVGKLDQHSAFIPPIEAKDFQESLEQRFGGIGIEVTVDPESKRLAVFSPLPGTPAYAAGLRAGDVIEKIDGEDTKGYKSLDALHKLRGEIGTPVLLSILSKGQTDPRDVRIVRAEIKVDSVLGDSRRPDGSWNFQLAENPRIGYIRLTNFGQNTSVELGAALAEVDVNCQALILDLRDDPGGLLPEAISVCDMFLESGPIVSTRGRDGSIDRQWSAEAGVMFDEKKALVILVNKYTASASEIVAACLQDHGRAVVIGQRSYGKGTVQHVIPLEPNRGVLKLTTRSYWRPSGKNIHRSEKATEADDWGVRPNVDFAIELSEDESRQLIRQRRERDVVRADGDAPPVAAEPVTPPPLPGTQAPTDPDEKLDPPPASELPAAGRTPIADEPELLPPGPIDDRQLRAAIQFLEGKLRLWDRM